MTHMEILKVTAFGDSTVGEEEVGLPFPSIRIQSLSILIAYIF